MFNEAFHTKEEFLETCKRQGWDTAEEQEFFGRFFDHVSELDREGRSDPLDLDSMGVNLAQMNGKNQTQRNIFLGKMREAFGNPAYDFSEELKDGFKKVESVVVISTDPMQKNLEEMDRKKQALMERNEEARKASEALLTYVDEALEKLVGEYEKMKAEEAKKKAPEEDDDTDPELKAAYDAKYVTIQFNLGAKGAYASKVSLQEYQQKLKQAGWTYPKDLAVFEALYRLSEVLDHPKLDNLLRDALNDSNALNANKRMSFLYGDVTQILSQFVLTDKIPSTLRNKITGCFDELDQETIDANYWDTFLKTRPKTWEENATIEWQKGQVKPGQEIIYDYTLTRFVEKAKDNGWTTEQDVKFVTDIYNYRKENKWTENRKMDKILMDIINYPIWGGANREKVLQNMEETFEWMESRRYFYSIDRIRKGQKPYITELKASLAGIKSRTDAYYEEQYLAHFGKAYQKTEDDLERDRKAREKERSVFVEKYRDAVWENRRVFDVSFRLSEEEFLNIAEGNGWLGASGFDRRDLNGLMDLYDVTRNSGNKQLLGLLNKILITEVDTKEKRDALVKDIRDTVSGVLGEDTIFGEDERKLTQISDGKGFVSNVSEKEIRSTLKSYENTQNREENLNELGKIVLRQGWDVEDLPFFESLYDFQTKKVNEKGISPIDEGLEALLKGRIGYFNTATKKNELLRQFKEAVATSSLDEDDKYDLGKTIEEKIQQGIREERKEREEKIFEDANIAIEPDVLEEPKKYSADAEFRSEENADRDPDNAEQDKDQEQKKYSADAEFRNAKNIYKERDHAEKAKIRKLLDEAYVETEMLRNKVAGEQIFNEEEPKAVPPVVNVKKEDQKEEKQEDRKEEQQEDRKEEQKEEQKAAEDQKSVADERSHHSDVKLDKSYDSDNPINDRESVRRPYRKKKHTFVDRDLSLDFDINNENPQDLEKTQSYVKNIYAFNFARISLMSALDKEMTKLSRAKQTSDVKSLNTAMKTCKSILKSNKYSMHEMYNALGNMSSLAQHTKGYDGLRTRVMVYVFSEAVRPLVDVSGAMIKQDSVNSAEVPVDDLYTEAKNAMAVYNIARPVKGAPHDAYVTLENKAKERFLLHDALSKACGKSIVTSFTQSGLVDSIVDMGRPKKAHEKATDQVAKSVLEQAGAKDANAATIKNLTSMIRNKGFARQVETLEKSKTFQDNFKKENDYRKQQRDAANKHMKIKAHGPRF